jgi:hypothetical protein
MASCTRKDNRLIVATDRAAPSNTKDAPYGRHARPFGAPMVFLVALLLAGLTTPCHCPQPYRI